MNQPAPKHPLTEWRRENGLNQAALAGKLGVSQPFLSRLESGEEKPSLEMSLLIFRITGLQIGVLENATSDDVEAVTRVVAPEQAA